jgi:hypothetical protein
MQDRLNFFEPWQHAPANHENQLTRALLVLLRYCPIAHQVWLSLVDVAARSPSDGRFPKLALHSMLRPTFATQRAQVLESGHQPETNEPIKGISVLCAADASNAVQSAVLESDRSQVLDGIINYGDIVIILESKLSEAADDRQARNINFHGQPIQFIDPVRRISWRDVLACFTDLADEKRSLVSGAEREILKDFLAFVEKHFAQLGPFNTLSRCAQEPSRIRRRLDAILRDVLDTDDTILPGIHRSVKLAHLLYDEEERRIALRMWPADTLEQARSFYTQPEAVERVLAILNKDWNVEPNFHFGFMATGYCRTATAMSVTGYVRYWLEHIAEARKIERPEWDRYWRDLISEEIARPEDRESFDRDFTYTNRGSATPRPGIECTFGWKLDEAERLDARGTLAGAVRDRINQLLEALGEPTVMGK